MYKWIMAVLFFGGCIFGIGYLTLSPSDKVEPGEGVVIKKPAKLVAASDPAFKNVYPKSSCISCHGTDLKGLGSTPKLLGIGDKHDKDGILKIIKEGYNSMQPQYEDNITRGLTDADLESLAVWLSKQKAE